MKRLQVIVLSSLFVLGAVTAAQANEWIPVTGIQTLQDFMSDMKAERTLANGEISRGEYRPDGTGTLHAWGASISRTWEVKGDDQICISAERKTNCYQLERNSDNPNLYRIRDVASGKVVEFETTEARAIAKGEPKDTDNKSLFQ